MSVEDLDIQHTYTNNLQKKCLHFIQLNLFTPRQLYTKVVNLVLCDIV